MKTIFKKNGGFTLVELIVVIAILAILAGVAVPAYSGYVTKANMSNDRTLVREVQNALMLHSYSGEGNTGWVILSAEGARADETFGTAAMEAVFGANWPNTAKLSYDGWKGGVNQNYVNAYKESSLNGKDEKLLNQLGVLTRDLAGMIETMAGNDFKKFMKDNGLEGKGGQTMSNAAVLYAAELASKADSTKATDGFNTYFDSFINPVTDGSVPELTLLGTLTEDAKLGTFGACAAMYAQTEAFCQYIGDEQILTDFHGATEGIKNASDSQAATDAVMAAMKEAINAAILKNPGKALDYVSRTEDDGTVVKQGEKDATAFLGIMSAVNDNKSNLLGKIDSETCYTDGTAAGLMSSYIGAADLGVGEGEILVQLKPDGTIYVSTPDAAN